MKKLSKAILLGLIAIILVSMPVLAAVSYRAAYTITEILLAKQGAREIKARSELSLNFTRPVWCLDCNLG